MTQESELERLEAVVVKLLAKYDTLRKEKLNLEDELATREMELEDLQLKLDSAKTERGDVTNRVEGLLGQIEDWEASLDEDVDDTQEQEEENSEEIEEEESDDSDARVQHNLFNVDPQAESNMG